VEAGAKALVWLAIPALPYRHAFGRWFLGAYLLIRCGARTLPPEKPV